MCKILRKTLRNVYKTSQSVSQNFGDFYKIYNFIMYSFQFFFFTHPHKRIVYILGKTALVRRYTEGNRSLSSSPFCRFSQKKKKTINSLSKKLQKTKDVNGIYLRALSSSRREHTKREENRVARSRKITGARRRRVIFRWERKEILSIGLSALSETRTRAAAARTPPLIRAGAGDRYITSVLLHREVLLELQGHHRRRFCDKNARLGFAH